MVEKRLRVYVDRGDEEGEPFYATVDSLNDWQVERRGFWDEIGNEVVEAQEELLAAEARGGFNQVGYLPVEGDRYAHALLSVWPKSQIVRGLRKLRNRRKPPYDVY